MSVTADPATFRRRFARLLNLDAHAEQALLTLLYQSELASGDRLINQGEHAGMLYLIWDGELSVTCGRGASELELARLGPGRWAGELTFLEPGPASASVTAVGPAVVFGMSPEDFRLLGRTHPQIAGGMLQAISRDLAGRLRASGLKYREGESPSARVTQALHGLFGGDK